MSGGICGRKRWLPTPGPPSALARKLTLHVRRAGMFVDKEFLDAFFFLPPTVPLPIGKEDLLADMPECRREPGSECRGSTAVPGSVC